MPNNEPDDWIYDIIPAKQVEEIEHKANKLEFNLNNGLNVVLSASNDSAIKLCRAFVRSMEGDMKSWIYIQEFISSLIQTIEMHLEEEGIDPYAK